MLFCSKSVGKCFYSFLLSGTGERSWFCMCLNVGIRLVCITTLSIGIDVGISRAQLENTTGEQTYWGENVWAHRWWDCLFWEIPCPVQKVSLNPIPAFRLLKGGRMCWPWRLAFTPVKLSWTKHVCSPLGLCCLNIFQVETKYLRTYC